MKKTLALCCLFLLPGRVETAVAADSPALLDTWSAAKTLNFSALPTPAGFAQSSNFELSAQKVFMLGGDNRLHVYSAADGGPLGSVPIKTQIAAFDIDPRGSMLYLASKAGTFTAVAVSFNTGALSWSVQKSWKLDGAPVDLAVSGGKVFVLEQDSAVHVYSADGARLGSIPVEPGTAAVEFLPRTGTLCLLNRDSGAYTALAVSF